MGVSWAGENRHIAVIGSGVAGLSAAWLLSKRYRVTLFERDRRLGGHSNTLDVPTPDGVVPVDTGFIVYNNRTYPNLTALFEHLGIASYGSDMSFGASIDGGALEYSSASLGGFIGQPANLVRGRYWSMLRDILRFYQEAPKLLDRSDLEGQTLGDYLDANGYSTAFVDDHLLPMGAAIWSTTSRQMRAYPLIAFVRFFASHGLLSLNVLKRPRWRTVLGGSRMYVARLADGLDVRLGADIATILRRPEGVEIVHADGQREQFTDVVIATHADQALRLLGDADANERSVLGAFTYTDNTAVLHTDATLMPRRRRTWASWNYIGDTGTGEDTQLCVTYWMNRLQQLSTRTQVFLTLNPTRPIAEGHMHQAIAYTHPHFDHAALTAQRELPGLQGRRNTWFAGSYFGHGFHEDALKAGLEAAEVLGGVMRPWATSAAATRQVRLPEAVA